MDLQNKLVSMQDYLNQQVAFKEKLDMQISMLSLSIAALFYIAFNISVWACCKNLAVQKYACAT